MFEGFSDRTFEYFMAIRFNNNRAFFLENHGWYEEAVRTPMRELAMALSSCMEALDPELDIRPEKAVSRINRDTRFSNDKSPYRDYMWLSFRRPGIERKTTIGAYFDVSLDGASYGMGIYDENRPYMNGLRHALLTEEDAFLAAWLPAKERFTLQGSRFKRMPVPETLGAEAALWYPMRGFYVERELNDFDLLRSPALVQEIESGFALLTPLYRWLRAIQEIDNP